jgi:aminopeptidase N
MRKTLVCLALVLACTPLHADDNGLGVIFHHDLAVTVDPSTSQLDVENTVTVPDSMALDGLTFSLHEGLSPQSLTDGVTIQETEEKAEAADRGMDHEDYSSEVNTTRYRIRVKNGLDAKSFKLAYGGKIHHPVKQIEQEYARGFSQSPGLIDPQGVYLAGATAWIPTFGDEYVTYDMTVRAPAGWKTVSQGKRAAMSDTGDWHVDHWEVETPTEEIFVIAAQFVEYEYPVGNVMAMAFLREKDDGLANKYLETTAQYMEMYRGLLGPYPYSKFALVENFWETGYGMPSFTLLGQQVIRFPFILHSSYPHELLHNWWGNGVFVDFDSGNWCEGLTTYMADHLIAEQRGTGADYRRSTLQGYTDYVTDENEFPLSEFLSRTNASSSSIGYGKTMMVWDMLRSEVGDDDFRKAFQKFYRDNTFRRASFGDVRAAFEEVTGRDFNAFFEQWVNRSGAPVLAIDGVRAVDAGDGRAVELELVQQQGGAVYTLSVPVVVYTADEARVERVAMDSRTQSFVIPVRGEPLRVEVDPGFNLMRRLDYREIPPAMSKMFGAEKTLIILPSSAADDERARYELLAETWKGDSGDAFEVRLDSEVAQLPADRSVWVLGVDNRWRSAVEQGLADYDADIAAAEWRFGSEVIDPASNSVVVALRHPGNTDLAIAWVTVHDIAAVAGLARKLPHYGKYSYLGFEGDEPTNVLKGQWPAVGSPLSADLAPIRGDLPKPDKRPALATLAPVFNAARMQADVETLADDAMQGRGVGTAGLDAAADYIAAQFEAAGLEPAGDDGGWFQPFTMQGEDGSDVTVRNVLGVIPGTNADWADQSVVVSAHYDHLGFGWPETAARNKGRIHAGAEDNASGVAVMLELARTLGKSMEPERSVVFAAFTAEESGLKGARYYVKNQQRFPVDKVMGNLNIDTVGRLDDGKLLVLSADSAREWKFIFMGASFVTGVQTEMPAQQLDASDQVAFIEAGVPGVQFFAGPGPDYHKPSDTADKIDYNGLVKVASVVREGVEYLAGRPDPMAFQGTESEPAAQRPSTGGKSRAATGVIPDFAFSGQGVAVGGVHENSPAQRAGLVEGDVIVAINGEDVADLREYSGVLGQLAPGDEIELSIIREGQAQKVRLVLTER